MKKTKGIASGSARYSPIENAQRVQRRHGHCDRPALAMQPVVLRPVRVVVPKSTAEQKRAQLMGLGLAGHNVLQRLGQPAIGSMLLKSGV